MDILGEKGVRNPDLGDKRLDARLCKIVESLTSSPGMSIPEAAGSAGQAKAFYRFFDSEHVEPQKIRDAAVLSTLDRIEGLDVVLLIQDTTTIDYSHHPATEGLGPTSSSGGHGMHVHTTMAVTSDGVPLGIVDQQDWARDNENKGLRHTRRDRDITEKESYCWLASQLAAQEKMPGGTLYITIADREADIYELFAMPRPELCHLLIRADHNRNTDAGYLWKVVSEQEICATMSVELGRADDREPRTANLAVRYKHVSIHPPIHLPKGKKLPKVEMTAVLVQEVDAPDGVEPIHWLLLTTLPVDGAEDAVNCVCWYSHRWLIERYHYVLKSGCKVESLQLRTFERLERALAVYCMVAWELLWLTYLARRQPEQSCEVALTPNEWRALYTVTYKKQPPQNPPALGEAVIWIARLGGFLARKSDGYPGVKVLWRGWIKLQSMVVMFEALLETGLPPPANGHVGNA